MAKSVEQAAADYYEAQEEYQSCLDYLGPDAPETLEAEDRLKQAEWEYNQALDAEEAGQCSEGSGSNSSSSASSQSSNTSSQSSNSSSSSSSSSSNSSSSEDEDWYGDDETCSEENQGVESTSSDEDWYGDDETCSEENQSTSSAGSGTSSSSDFSSSEDEDWYGDDEMCSEENQSTSSSSSGASEEENWWDDAWIEDDTCSEDDELESSDASEDDEDWWGDEDACDSETQSCPGDSESSEGAVDDWGNPTGGTCQSDPDDPNGTSEESNEDWWGDGLSTCDPTTQSCSEDTELFCSTDDYTNAYVACGPESTVTVPEVSSLMISVLTKGGAPIRNAKVEITDVSAGGDPIVRNTNQEGLCAFHLLEEGDYDYAVTKEGFGPVTGGDPGTIYGYVHVNPATTTALEVNPLHSGPMEIVVFNANYEEVSTDQVMKGSFLTLQAKFPRVIDGEFRWTTTSDKIQLVNDTTEFVRVFGKALSEASVYETIELEFKPKGENAFPRQTFKCRVIPSLLSITMTDSTGAIITQGLVTANDSITIKAEGPLDQMGVISWKTNSADISFPGGVSGSPQTYTGKTINIKGLSPSAYKGEASVEVTFTPVEGEVVTDTVLLTVIKGSFKQSKNNKYGFDEMSGAANDPPHVSVAAEKETYVTLSLEKTAGMSVDSVDGEIFFDIGTAVCDLGEVKKVSGSNNEFDVQIKAQSGDASGETKINARLHRIDGPIIATVAVNRYKFMSFSASWGMFYDSTSPATTMTLAATTADLQNRINNIWIQMCASVKLSYCDNQGDKPIDVRFEKGAKDGMVAYLYKGKSAEQTAIENAFPGGGQKVIVVRDMETHFTLEKDAKAGDKTITVKPFCDFFNDLGRSYKIKDGANSEEIQVTEKPTVQGQKVLKIKTTPPPPPATPPTPPATPPATPPTPPAAPPTPPAPPPNPGLQHDHAAGTVLIYPAAGWSGNPVYLAGLPTVKELAETMAHELGHSLLTLSDVTEPTNVMYRDTGNTDTRLRFIDLQKNYVDSGGPTESQWKKLSRGGGSSIGSLLDWLGSLF